MRKSWYTGIIQPVCRVMLTMMILHWAFAQAQGQPADPNPAEENRTLYSSFASGQKFYLENDSFQPAGDGKLQYNVTSDTGNGGRRVSQNEIDCTTGQFKSPIESWQEDSQGRVSDQKPGPVVTMTLNQKTQLYRTLKDACQKNLPDVQGSW
jgi:hypothetical protein